uniref:Small ribosomal subunit protein uS2c n=1 Tax=Gracilaria tenuistipitata var. liui TaxID=285951 RepID=RR2_GRATL|nr:ribosomal protein S2 [Gracilaria tenuistipitata var. liui]Q6B8R5.1 RecName: Full=Small ribosomal subunit protein uS2c; AltName: Full=30S ribosomal protein S2, chloroplastic [Gracilaria tenuistipitata var. liui]AAT79720.1 30S ribosomal protein S2 [Gracilaria tenuistipitata var. liui]
MSIVSLSELLEAGAHFGHQARRWNPRMFPYIYTERNGIHIIDLVQTAQLLTEACQFIRDASQEGKKFLFLGTKRQAAGVIAEQAIRSNSYYVNQRWLGGMLTNWMTIKSRVERLQRLEMDEQAGLIDMLPKKEAAINRRELDKLRKNLNGIKNMSRLPDFIVVVDQKRETTAIQECIKLGIPIICILDTNCNPEIIDIPIPANDDAIRSIKLIISRIADSIIEGSTYALNK